MSATDADRLTAALILAEGEDCACRWRARCEAAAEGFEPVAGEGDHPEVTADAEGNSGVAEDVAVVVGVEIEDAEVGVGAPTGNG